ncbi:hypothetical protein niasHT_007636 [Heterodera trifolii]|uniref:Uncharacterized protein n=1 Tax=Heterodera trifolii TaxID=157864 RepID=A0ABD2LPR3_9BILA
MCDSEREAAVPPTAPLMMQHGEDLLGNRTSSSLRRVLHTHSHFHLLLLLVIRQQRERGRAGAKGDGRTELPPLFLPLLHPPPRKGMGLADCHRRHKI